MRIRILSLQELKYRYHRLRNCLALFRMFLTICGLLFRQRRRYDNVREVFQAVLDHPDSLVVMSSNIYYGLTTGGIPHPDKMRRAQSELYYRCLIDLRLWKPSIDKGGILKDSPWFYNILTQDRVHASYDYKPLVYQDPRINELLEGYGLGTAWPDERAFASTGSPFQVPFNVPAKDSPAKSELPPPLLAPLA